MKIPNRPDREREAVSQFDLSDIGLVSRETLRFVEVNATAARMLGYTLAELVLLGPADVSETPCDHLQGVYDAMIAGDDNYGMVQTHLIRKDGSRLPVDVRQHAHLAGADWITVGVVRDHTERNEAEEKLRRLNRLYAMVSATAALVMRVHDRAVLFARVNQPSAHPLPRRT